MENELFVFGVLAILGASTVAIADMFLLGSPISCKEFRAKGIDVLLTVSPRNMFIGHTLGVLALPLYLFGIMQIYRALEPAGAFHALPPVMIMIYMIVVGAAAHACFAFVGGAMQLQQREDGAGEQSAEEMVRQHKRLLYPLFGAYIAGLIVSSIWFGVVVWTQPTLYPKWMAFTNPFVLFISFGLLERLLPAPVGGYVRPANGNICFAVFFGISTIALT